MRQTQWVSVVPRNGVPSPVIVVSVFVLVSVLIPDAAPAKPAPSVEPIQRALRAGRYEEARRLACSPRSRAAAADLAGLLLCARAEVALGLHADARKRLEAAAANHPDDLPLRDALMRLYETVGDRDALAQLIDVSYADWNAGAVARTKPADLLAIATAARLDRNWKDANDVLRDAVRADPRGTAANLDWGDVLLQKHNADDAAAAFKDVIKQDPENPDAHAGLARVAIVDRYDGAAALEEIARVLAVNPAHAGALALRAQLALDSEDWAGAKADVAALRRTNPRDAGAARITATAALLLDDRAGYEAARDAALAVRPRDSGFFAFVAEALTRHRRYDEARAVAAEGVAADADDAACLSVLAMTLLRLGDETTGLETLRRAWKNDPYDVRTFNLLNLFEKVIPARYTTIASAHFRFRIPPDARTAITEVVAPFLEERYKHYVTRYGFEPAGPIMFELYGEPREFAVRTVGLPAIGVAGVCFGKVITSQAPTNHAFNWGMVLAHELAHVFAIQLSRGRVPRWLTEGLSEVETMRARPEWTRHDDVSIYRALRRGDLPGLLSLSNAFITARTSDDAARTYAHSALAVDFLERRFGFAAIREALAAFGRGEREAAVLQRLAGMPGDALDKEFRVELTQRLARYEKQYMARPAEAPAGGASARSARAAGNDGKPAKPNPAAANPATANLTTAGEWAAAGLAALKTGDLDGARKALDKARAVAQPPPEDQADVLFLAGEIALARRDADAAVAAFEGLLGVPATAQRATAAREIIVDGYDVRVRLGLAEIRRKRPAAAEAHLRRAIDFDPTRVEPHVLLAELYKDQQRVADRLGALAAALRLEPQNDAVAKQVVLGDAAAGRTTRVVELAPIAIFIDPADPDLHAALGRALAATGKAAAGAAALERALLFRPKQPTLLHQELAALYDRLGDRGKAAAHRAAAR
jgi:tetratricopeptide (TPR) repeat protein